MSGSHSTGWDEPYDAFVSYAIDDGEDRVRPLIEQIEREFRAFSPGRAPKLFFDRKLPLDVGGWERDVRKALRESKTMLAIISPAYLRPDTPESPNLCRREWREFVRLDLARQFAAGAWPGEPIIPIFVTPETEVRKSISPESRKWWEVMQRLPGVNAADYWARGANAFRDGALRERLHQLASDLFKRCDFGRRLAAVPRRMMSRVPTFVGRDGHLRQLHDHLTRHGIAAVYAAHDISGIGKSSVAREYAWRYRPDYLGGQFEIDLSQTHKADQLRAQISTLAREHLDPSIPTNAAESMQFELAMAAFNGLPAGRKALLLLDNLSTSDASLLNAASRGILLPSPEKVHVVVTTRAEESLLSDLTVVRVDLLSHGEALDVLARHRPFAIDESDPEVRRLREGTLPPSSPAAVAAGAAEPEWKQALTIANRLSRHTLSLALAGGYLGVRRELTLGAFLKTMDIAGTGMSAHEASRLARSGERLAMRVDAESLVEQVCAGSLEWLEKTAPLAMEVLGYASYLPPGDVPTAWLDALAGEGGKEARRAHDPKAVRKAIRLLLDLQYLLGAPGQPQVRMHPVVQAVVRRRANASQGSRGWLGLLPGLGGRRGGRERRLRRALSHALTRSIELGRGSAMPPGSGPEVLTLLQVCTIYAGHADAARTGLSIVALLQQLGRMSDAYRAATQARDTMEHLAALSPTSRHVLRDLSISYEKVGDVSRAWGICRRLWPAIAKAWRSRSESRPPRRSTPPRNAISASVAGSWGTCSAAWGTFRERWPASAGAWRSPSGSRRPPPPTPRRSAILASVAKSSATCRAPWRTSTAR